MTEAVPTGFDLGFMLLNQRSHMFHRQTSQTNSILAEMGVLKNRPTLALEANI